MGCTPNHIWDNVIFGENKTSSTGQTLELRSDIQIFSKNLVFWFRELQQKLLIGFIFVRPLYTFSTPQYINIWKVKSYKILWKCINDDKRL